jgi:hypothetical protein
MTPKELRSVLKEIEQERRSVELREIFLEKGVKFYDAGGWGYMKNRVKTYVEKNESQDT